ncbi:MAG: single-stranded-DNA-specific exonuclease RecJ [Bacteroidetes bacterium]|nr:single-stranded-DNA-specific exonuclease RecJ [Bacteroidota bacterium]
MPDSIAITSITTVPVNGSNPGNIIITATAGNYQLEYSLNAVDYQPTATFSIPVSGSYTVYVRSESGCIVQKTVVVNSSNEIEELNDWNVYPNPAQDILNVSLSLSKNTGIILSLNIHPVLCRLLVQRGIETYEQAKYFFRPELSDLHDPFLMKDMDKAINWITLAIERNEKILIYGDYDVDGTTSVATVYSFLKEFYPNRDYYIPNRYTEGYGISTKGIDFAVANNFSLIIALDCGIKSNDKVDYAHSKGIDFIICDHHNPGEEIPKAVAVLDPKRSDCTYPYKELSGCGIGFKLIQAFSIQNGIPPEKYLQYLDLVCVSIGSDIVPITGENRILAYHGLKKLNTNPVNGLRKLLEISSVKKEMTITDVVFILGPRINAAGRIDDAKHAVKLLISEDIDFDAESHAFQLNKLNNERKGLDKDITAHALEMIGGDEILCNRKSTVLFHPEWHKGVIGIVASRLTETYYRPTVVLTESDGKVTGSARSVKNFDLYEAIYECRDLLLQFGGHKFAAGLTMSPDKVEAFSKRFEKVIGGRITDEQLIPQLDIDSELSLEDITPKFYSVLQQMGPFGPENMTPLFITRGVRDTGWSKIVKEEHLKFSLRMGRDEKIDGIGFGLAKKMNLVKSGPFDIAYHIEENEWNGNITLQMMVKDIS